MSEFENAAKVFADWFPFFVVAFGLFVGAFIGKSFGGRR